MSKVIYSPTKPLNCGARVWIETEAEVDLQRIGAKALANLSSTDKDTRIAVVKYVNKHVPDWQNFNDHIVNVYLEMLFTN